MRLFSHLSHVLLAMCAIALPTSVCWAEDSASASSPDTQTAKPAVRKHHKHAKHHGAAAKAGQKPSADTKLDSKTDTKTDKPEGKVHVRKTADKNNDQRATHGRTAHRDADSTTHGARAAKSAPKTCVHDPVTVVRGSDNHTETFPLTQCNGRPVQGSLAKLSSLAQSVAAGSATKSHHENGQRHVATPKQLDTGLLSRVQLVASHFGGKSIRIASGYRPLSARSYHQSGRALDIVIPGVANEDLVAFCRTIPDTGCGYYPNSTFVHIDARPTGTGHVYWIDTSKPGEAPHYVSAWPEKQGTIATPTQPPPDADSLTGENAEEAKAGDKVEKVEINTSSPTSNTKPKAETKTEVTAPTTTTGKAPAPDSSK